MQLIANIFVFLFIAGSLIPVDDQEIGRGKTEHRSKYLEVVENLAGLDARDPLFTAKCMRLGESNTTNSELLALIDYMSISSDESKALLQIAQENRTTICRAAFDHREFGAID